MPRRHYAQLGEVEVLGREFSRSTFNIDPDKAGLGLGTKCLGIGRQNRVPGVGGDAGVLGLQLRPKPDKGEAVARGGHRVPGGAVVNWSRGCSRADGSSLLM